jgi:hypothetical protein
MMIDYSNNYRFDYFYGWRFLMSPAFRNRMRTRWGQSPWLRLLSYTGVIISLLLTTAAAVFTLMAGWHLMNG